jgi:hypothetical protein
MGVMILDAENGEIFVNSVTVVAVDMMQMHADIPPLANAADTGIHG